MASRTWNFWPRSAPATRSPPSRKVVSIEAQATGETMTLELNAANHAGAAGVSARSSGSSSAARRNRVPPTCRRRRDPVAAIRSSPSRKQIDHDQTFRYAEASGDRNPIHVDENIAKMAGLPGIIVHGLCTMAFASKVMIDRLCGGDPVRLKRLRVRFSGPVLPGQIITTKVWTDGERDGRKISRVRNLQSRREGGHQGRHRRSRNLTPAEKSASASRSR